MKDLTDERIMSVVPMALQSKAGYPSPRVILDMARAAIAADRALNAPADRDVMRQMLRSVERTHAGYMVGHDKSDAPSGSYSDGFTRGFGECVRLLRELAAAPTPPAEQPAEPDQQLCRFYQAQTFPELVSAMELHIERLQAKLPRGEQPAFTRVREG